MTPSIKINKNKGKQLLNKLIGNEETLLFIHYSCEEFNLQHNYHPRIVSISVKNFANADIKYFSLFQTASDLGIDSSIATDAQLHTIECQMLKQFNSFVNDNVHNLWVHWQMNAAKYGFEAISARYKFLYPRARPKKIPYERKVNLVDILKLKFTDDFEGRIPSVSRLLNLAGRNSLRIGDAITGEEEVEAYDQRQFRRIQQSSIAKVELMNDVYIKLKAGKLKVAPSWLKRNEFKVGNYDLLSPKGVMTLILTGLLYLGFKAADAIFEKEVQNNVAPIFSLPKNDSISKIAFPVLSDSIPNIKSDSLRTMADTTSKKL